MVRGKAVTTDLTSPKRVKELRQRLGRTQGQFSQKIGVTYGLVNHWENGKRRSQPFVEKVRQEQTAGVECIGRHVKLSLPKFIQRADMENGKTNEDRERGLAGARGTILPTVILDALVLRGVEDDSETIARLAGSTKFRNTSMAHKTAILERHVDIARLFGAYTWDTLPTRYLESYIPSHKLQHLDAVARKRAGVPWPQTVERAPAIP